MGDKADLVDTMLTTYDRKHRLGTMFRDPVGGFWKYGKISFGRCSKGEFRFYEWIPWNGTARFKALGIIKEDK